ncbi:rhodopsin-like, partial [Pecten maximus]|uniref:rhodopsin-like n=1 Tax=Pecten maximus TaxID=6579 RepID=UPI001457ED5F
YQPQYNPYPNPGAGGGYQPQYNPYPNPGAGGGYQPQYNPYPNQGAGGGYQAQYNPFPVTVGQSYPPTINPDPSIPMTQAIVQGGPVLQEPCGQGYSRETLFRDPGEHDY